MDGCCGAHVKAAAGPEGHVGRRAWERPSLTVLHPGQLDPSPALADTLQPERDESLRFAASGASLSHGVGEFFQQHGDLEATRSTFVQGLHMGSPGESQQNRDSGARQTDMSCFCFAGDKSP